MTTKYENVKLVAHLADGSEQQLLHDGEPFLLVRAQDLAAVAAVRSYQALYELLADTYGPGHDAAMVEGLEQLRRDMEEWQRRNPGLVKVPD